jgi:hypothetical protein
MTTRSLLYCAAAFTLMLGLQACNATTGGTNQINFGDDRSQWAFDGECDDPRFYGAGMTTTPLLDEDRYHDATDCRRQFEAGRIALR